MKKNQIKISYYYIIIYLLFILIPFHFNKYLKNNAIETIEVDLMNKKYNFFKYEDYKEGEPKKRINDKEREKGPDDDEMPDEIKELIDKIDDLNRKIDITKTNITKNKIYMVFFSILDTILFLIIIIYTSVKCFVLSLKLNSILKLELSLLLLLFSVITLVLIDSFLLFSSSFKF